MQGVLAIVTTRQRFPPVAVLERIFQSAYARACMAGAASPWRKAALCRTGG